jgi:hypothetical protein
VPGLVDVPAVVPAPGSARVPGRPGWLVEPSTCAPCTGSTSSPTGRRGAGQREEAPVEQPGRLVGHLGLGAHQGDHQAVPVALGGAHEAGPGRVGVAVLDAERPVVALQQPVLARDLDALPARRGDAAAPGGGVAGELRVAHAGPGDQRQVVRRADLALGVQPVRVHRPGVERAELAGRVVHQLRGGLGPPAAEARRSPRRCRTPPSSR